jgi:hypothetical protein
MTVGRLPSVDLIDAGAMRPFSRTNGDGARCVTLTPSDVGGGRVIDDAQDDAVEFAGTAGVLLAGRRVLSSTRSVVAESPAQQHIELPMTGVASGA